MAKKKARFSHLFYHKVFTKDIKHEYKSFIFLSRKCAGQFVVNCEYHVYRYCYILKLSKTNSIERLICLAVLPKKNCYGQASIRENSATMLACVAGVIGEGERGRREKMKKKIFFSPPSLPFPFPDYAGHAGYYNVEND